MRVTCERCLRRYDVPDATVKGRKIRARCKCGARVVVQDEERAAKSLAAGSQTTGSIQRPVRWFVDITSWEPIAMDLRQLVRAFDAGRVDADTLVWRKGMPDWRRLRDVSELAERLLGGGEAGAAVGADRSSSDRPGGDRPGSDRPGSDRPGSDRPSPEQGQSALLNATEPPPRQAERSRTPPASYTVGSRSSSPAERSESEPPAADRVAARSGSEAPPERMSSPPGGDNPKGAPFSRGAGPRSAPGPARQSHAPYSAAQHAAAQNSSSSPSGAPRPASRRGRGKAPSRPNAAPLNARTVTQTGLESPADVVARHSSAPPAPDSPEAGRSSGASSASSVRSRDSRSGTPPGGLRRPASSDETPAQKPSSLSVPPGAMVSGASGSRGRRMVALAALVLGGVIMIRQLASNEVGPTATRQGPDAEGPNATPPKQVENARAPKAAATRPEPGVALPVPAHRGSELDALPPAPAAAVMADGKSASSEGAASSDAVRAGQVEGAGVNPGAAGVATNGAVASGPSDTSTPPSDPRMLPAPIAARAAPARGSEPSAPPLNVEASARESIGAVPPLRTPVPAPARAPVATTPRPAAAATPRPAPRPAPPVQSPAVEPAVPRPPRPFDETLATQQFEVATSEAARCSEAGSTRGIGRVKVSIEPWGRVGRVTHLTQDFVGTGVGLCVMQAYQRIQVPAFDGNSRSLAGEFVVE